MPFAVSSEFAIALARGLDFLSNLANLSKWSSALESAEWTTHDAHGAGSTYRVSAKLLGSKKEGLVEIVQWDRPNLYSYRLTTRMFPIERMESTIRLEPQHGSTKVSFESHFELIGPLKFTEGFFAKMGEKQDGKNFDVVKRLLEAG
jgi:hypothetical protein